MRKPKGTDIHVESRARDRARWLVRDHGDEAEAVIVGKIRSSRKGSEERYLYRLTRRQLATLQRVRHREAGGGLSRLWRRLFGNLSRGRRRLG